MEFRTNRSPPRGVQSQAFRSVSQLALSGDHKNSSVGLRKLAASIRSTVKGDKIEIERFRSSSREKPTLTDPRFRRERTRSPKKASTSRSESRFAPNYEKTNSHSTPAIAKASTFTKSPQPVKLQQQQQQPVEVKFEDVLKIRAEESKPEIAPASVKIEDNDEEEYEETLDVKEAILSASLENHVNSLVKSLLSNGEEDDEERIPAKNNLDKDDSVVSSKSSVSFKRRSNSWGGNQANLLNGCPYTENNRFLKKFAYVMARERARRTSSAENLPAAQPANVQRTKVQRERCPCVKCAPPSYNTEEVLKEHFKMPVLFLTGSGIAVVLMAFIAWVLSNDFIWNLVNNWNYREVERRHTLVYLIVSYIGGAALFTINLIFGSIYNLFILPRNAVFKSAEEPWTPWQYVNIK